MLLIEVEVVDVQVASHMQCFDCGHYPALKGCQVGRFFGASLVVEVQNPWWGS